MILPSTLTQFAGRLLPGESPGRFGYDWPGRGAPFRTPDPRPFSNSGRSPAAATVDHRKDQAASGLGHGHWWPRMVDKGEKYSAHHPRGDAPDRLGPVAAAVHRLFHSSPGSEEAD